MGLLPKPGDIDLNGLDFTPGSLEALLTMEAGSWHDEMQSIAAYFSEYGRSLPAALAAQLERVQKALGRV